MRIPVKGDSFCYDIILERGAISRVFEYLSLDRKVLVVTDSGVPAEYAERVAKQCKTPVTVTIPAGEASKCFDSYQRLLKAMLEHGFTRGDCVVAVGGGVVGDLSGFVAASYMRGIDFYNIPTTFLSQVDSSIGGKVAIDFEGVKNIVGAFYQPKCVVIDPELLSTLDPRQLHAGLAESIKMAATSDGPLFELLEGAGELDPVLDMVIERSLLIKRAVVESDPTEKGLRKVLNFGHTLGHAIESANMGALLHGECVALGMLPMCSSHVRERLSAVLKKYDLPTEVTGDREMLLSYVLHDKKAYEGGVSVVYVPEIGSFAFKRATADELRSYLERLI